MTQCCITRACDAISDRRHSGLHPDECHGMRWTRQPISKATGTRLRSCSDGSSRCLRRTHRPPRTRLHMLLGQLAPPWLSICSLQGCALDMMAVAAGQRTHSHRTSQPGERQRAAALRPDCGARRARSCAMTPSAHSSCRYRAPLGILASAVLGGQRCCVRATAGTAQSARARLTRCLPRARAPWRQSRCTRRGRGSRCCTRTSRPATGPPRRAQRSRARPRTLRPRA